MGNNKTTSAQERRTGTQHKGYESDLAAAERRLEALITLNAEFESENSGERRAPVSDLSAYSKTYSFLGLSLGVIPSTAFFIRIFSESPGGRVEPWVFILFGLVVLGSSVCGYFTGKLVGRIVAEIETFSWPLMIALLPFIGVTWGILAGGAGGVFIFLFGAIPGAVIGGAVGAFAMTVFTILHRLLSVDGELRGGKLPPLAMGVSALAAALILGFPLS
jgi:hypothetical protein